MLMLRSTHKRLMNYMVEDVEFYKDRYYRECNKVTEGRKTNNELRKIINEREKTLLSFKRNPFLVFPWFFKNKIRNFLR